MIGPSTPSARSAPRTKVVLPAPSSPETSTTSPGRSVAGELRAGVSVRSGRRQLSRGHGGGRAARGRRRAGAPRRRPGSQSRRRCTAASGPGRAAWPRGRAGAARARAGWAAPAPAWPWLQAPRRRRRLGLFLLLRAERVGVLIVAGALRGRRRGEQRERGCAQTASARCRRGPNGMSAPV